MCNHLHLENQDKFTPIGGVIPGNVVEGNPFKLSYQWKGFVRLDGSRDRSKKMGEQWKPNEWHPVLIKADQFIERNRDLNYSKTFDTIGKKIAAVVNKRGELRVITRPSSTEIEKRVHHRMPFQPNAVNFNAFLDALNHVTGSKYGGA